jgi:hypothetical protein
LAHADHDAYQDSESPDHKPTTLVLEVFSDELSCLSSFMDLISAFQEYFNFECIGYTWYGMGRGRRRSLNSNSEAICRVHHGYGFTRGVSETGSEGTVTVTIFR